ncbi:SDR family NAD(P)-dependent oxidoreductase [Flavobacterium ajazii]|uniref:SDR family NAD(P)-dependent oxidoreductase n=1 Tax=Flavobacterium ajazii TaxID=2692318 RepID=UPI0013D600C0|nr:SDR family NAD(P)-dependent oxidoreductase [Flavobacterium ajazii]
MNRHALLIGGAGFIGSQLAKILLSLGYKVTIVDNFSRGKLEYLEEYKSSTELKVLNFDIAENSECEKAFIEAKENADITEVWHMAANSDIPAGVLNPAIDLKDTFLTTFEVLKVMKKFNVKVINFASSSAIYGDFGDTMIHESIGPLLPISNYGAMKLASEAQISAAAEDFLDRANIFRFPNVVGVPATHGVILDFINKLLFNKNELQVLGDGTQQKAYLHVSDLINAMLLISNRQISDKVEIVNIGPYDKGVTVKWIAEQVILRVNPSAKIVFGDGNKGWVGDVPKFNYSTEKLRSFGWSPNLGSEDAVKKAIDQIALQLGV